MKGLKPASIAISLLTLAVAMRASPARAQPPTVPFKLYLTELWQLDDIQDSIISSLGVEQKKRVTIGVELAAIAPACAAVADRASAPAIISPETNFIRKLPSFT